jgi:hypothetical protein
MIEYSEVMVAVLWVVLILLCLGILFRKRILELFSKRESFLTFVNLKTTGFSVILGIDTKFKK